VNYKLELQLQHNN